MAEDTTLFKRLKRLFSTGAIVRRTGDGKLKVADTAQVKGGISNATRDKYFRLYNSSGYGTSATMQHTLSMAFQQQRIMLFRDYDIMDSDSIIHSALDIYADESTTNDENGDILKIICDDEDTKEILDNLYYDILNVEFFLHMWARSLCKYGDHYLFMEIAPDNGIINVIPLSVYDTIRVDGSNPEQPGYYYFETRGMGGKSQKLESYEVAHFRILGDGNFLPYGTSMLEGGRRVFRQLILMEDAMLIHRIMRAPEKRIFKIDVGNLPPSDIPNFMQQQMNRNKKVPFIDERSGQYNYNYNMQNLMEDFYFPVRGGDDGTSVENLGGLEYNAIEDIEYLKGRLLASLKIPKAFLGFEESLSGKATLAQEDIRFARTIERLQKFIESELYKMGIIHLYAQGIRDEKLLQFSVKLTNPSTIYEQEKVNLWKEKVLLARDINDLQMISHETIYKKFFNMSDEEIEQERLRVVDDTKRKFRLAAIESGQSDPAKFGFPQEQPAPMGDPNDPMGGGGMEAPMEGAEEMPQGLPEAREGRPTKGISYGQDNHYAGRDPMAKQDRYSIDPSNVEKRKRKRKSPLSVENAEQGFEKIGLLIEALDKKFPRTAPEEELIELEEEPRFMSENNIIDE